jgi:hypothetical protein
MNRIYSTIALIGILGFVSFAQKNNGPIADKPNFAGTWEIADEKGYPFKNRTLIITQTVEELTLVESLEFEKKVISNKTILYPDKRGERNLFLAPGADDEIEVSSTTLWKKDKLVRRSTADTPFFGSTGRFIVVIRETQTYSLSKDGNSLTIHLIHSRETPSGNISSGKRVFRRKN